MTATPEDKRENTLVFNENWDIARRALDVYRRGFADPARVKELRERMDLLKRLFRREDE